MMRIVKLFHCVIALMSSAIFVDAWNVNNTKDYKPTNYRGETLTLTMTIIKLIYMA